MILKKRNRLARFVLSRRKALGLNQTALGQRSELAQASISCIETGRVCYLQPGTIGALATGLKVSKRLIRDLVPYRRQIGKITRLGKLIVNLCRKRNLTLGQLYKKVGWKSRSDIYHVLHRSSLRYPTAQRLAKSLHSRLTPFAEFIYRSTGPKKTGLKESQTELGKITRQRRQSFGWTEDKLGRKLGVSRQAISNIETGRTKLLDKNANIPVRKLARVLRLSRRRLSSLRPPRKIKTVQRRPTAFGRELAKARLTAGLTLSALALKIGLSVQYLSRVESGWKKPSTRLVKKITEPLKAEELVRYANNPKLIRLRNEN